MNTIREMRLATGLSQLHLAGWLNVSPSHLSMAENGNRDLPVAARLKLHQTMDLLAQPAPGAHAGKLSGVQKKQRSHAAAVLKKHAARCQRKAAAHARQLGVIESRHAQASQALGNVWILQEQLTEGPEATKQKLALELAELEAIKKLQTPAAHQLVKLKLRISSLESQAANALQFAQQMETGA